MVEFALVAPIFFILIFAIIEGARFTFYYEMLNNAARDGARYAIVHGSNALDGCPSGPPAPDTYNCDEPGENVKQAVSNGAIGLVDSGSVTVSPPVWLSTPDQPNPGDPNTGDNRRGNYVTVFVEYTYSPIMPLLPPITISARSSLVINN
jgi:TadE-like protein